MSAANPRTIEELLAMPTDDIAKMTDAELTEWLAPFWPHTRPPDVVASAVNRELDRQKSEMAGSPVEQLLAAAKARAEAAKKAAAKNVTVKYPLPKPPTPIPPRT
jgi:hypothetical protein